MPNCRGSYYDHGGSVERELNECQLDRDLRRDRGTPHAKREDVGLERDACNAGPLASEREREISKRSRQTQNSSSRPQRGWLWNVRIEYALSFSAVDVTIGREKGREKRKQQRTRENRDRGGHPVGANSWWPFVSVRVF
jgi:hypothetical protein